MHAYEQSSYIQDLHLDDALKSPDAFYEFFSLPNPFRTEAWDVYHCTCYIHASDVFCIYVYVCSLPRHSSVVCSTTISPSWTIARFPSSYQVRTAAIYVLHAHSHRLVHFACICCLRCVCVYTQEGCIHILPDMVPVPVRLRLDDGRYVGEWCMVDRKIEVPPALDIFAKSKDTVALHQ